MQISITREALDGRYLAVRRAKSRHQATMDRFPVEPDSAGAAIAGIAALLDSEPAEVAGKSSQTLFFDGVRIGGSQYFGDGV
jgi:hypothetical protein